VPVKMLEFSGIFELEAVNTPEVKVVTIIQNLAEGSKAQLVNLAMDLVETRCDADGAICCASLKKGEQSSTSIGLEAANTIIGSKVVCMREAANTYRGKPSATFIQYRPNEVPLPVVEGAVKVTVCLGQSGASSAKANMSYRGKVVVQEP